MPAVKLDEGEESETEVRNCTAQLPSREEVIQALRACYDPCCRDRKISVVDMGLIEGIELRGQDVGIKHAETRRHLQPRLHQSR